MKIRLFSYITIAQLSKSGNYHGYSTITWSTDFIQTSVIISLMYLIAKLGSSNNWSWSEITFCIVVTAISVVFIQQRFLFWDGKRVNDLAYILQVATASPGNEDRILALHIMDSLRGSCVIIHKPHAERIKRKSTVKQKEIYTEG